MRFLTTSLVAILAALAITACSSGSSSADNSASSAASDNSAMTNSSDNSAMSGATDNSGSMTSASSAPMAGAAASIPAYPGAKTEAAGSSMGMSSGAASGKVLSTADSFDKVYAWYQKNMPAGSEKSHTTTPVQAAVFMLGDAGKSQQTVTISVTGGKTMISIAAVKQ